MECLIISGMSGAGKSLAADVLEDIGYYCMRQHAGVPHPPALSSCLKTPVKNTTKWRWWWMHAAVATWRPCALRWNRPRGRISVTASCIWMPMTRSLTNRHKANRRRHPLQQSSDISFAQALAQERAMLAPSPAGRPI